MRRTTKTLVALWLWLLGIGTAYGAAPIDCRQQAPYAVLHAAVGVGDARAVWLDARRLLWPGAPTDSRYRLYTAARGGIVAKRGARVRGADGALTLEVAERDIPARFRYLGEGSVLQLRAKDAAQLDRLLRGELVLVAEGRDGKVRDATGTQIAAALDARYAAAASTAELGAAPDAARTHFALWAPTAQAVGVCVAPFTNRDVDVAQPLQRDAASGVWSTDVPGDLSGRYFSYRVDVFVPGVGLVRQRVTDPYSVSLDADSQSSYVARLDAPALQPEGWTTDDRPAPLAAATDQVVYELHLRDFSAIGASVPAEHRGKYLAFTDADSAGMRHLKALAQAGLTDVHLLPVFDFAGVPEARCDASRPPPGAPDGEAVAQFVAAHAKTDCFTWGYAAIHFGAPEGSYASDANDGAARVLEFRRMVQALHRAGLRVGLDVVYNHTQAAGQDAQSVLDRVVPGYYQRLDATGKVEISTCCANTATENAMMARLMLDTAVRWVRDYRIDSFRFDLMGHQPREAMEALQRAVDAAAGRHIAILGEGWNFGEVKDGARFVQASQLSLAGTHLATLSDRARDAARGGGASDAGADLVARQGWLNGLGYAPNAATRGQDQAAALRHAADLVRVGLAGTLKEYVLRGADGVERPLSAYDYSGQPAGYAGNPDEVANYVENHDNPTLYDIDALRLPADTPPAERARVAVLGEALVLFSQGIAYVHAGQELLRSKSLDRNSNESGDVFNAIDWSGQDDGFGRGLPPGPDNIPSWDTMRPVLRNPTVKPAPAQIAWAWAAFQDLLRIRSSSTLFRLRSTDDVKQRLRFVNVGAQQEPTVVGAHLDGRGYAGAGFSDVVYFINVDTRAHAIAVPEEKRKKYVLHPLQRAKTAADARVREQARYAAGTGTFSIPARSAVVFVVEAPHAAP